MAAKPRFSRSYLATHILNTVDLSIPKNGPFSQIRSHISMAGLTVLHGARVALSGSTACSRGCGHRATAARWRRLTQRQPGDAGIRGRGERGGEREKGRLEWEVRSLSQ